MKQLSRHERIEILLDHYQDFFQPDASGGVSTGGKYSPSLPPMAHHPSVVELCRCLRLLEQHAPVQYRHLKAYYTAEWRNVDRPVRRRMQSGKWTLETARERERIVPAWVRLEKVRRALGFVTDSFRGDPFLPNELLDIAA